MSVAEEFISKPVSEKHEDPSRSFHSVRRASLIEFSFGEVAVWKLKMEIHIFFCVALKSHRNDMRESKWWRNLYFFVNAGKSIMLLFSCKVNFTIYCFGCGLWFMVWDSGLISMPIWFQSVNMSANVAQGLNEPIRFSWEQRSVNREPTASEIGLSQPLNRKSILMFSITGALKS